MRVSDLSDLADEVVEDHKSAHRYKNSVDTVSLNDFDASEGDLSELIGDDVDFQSIMRLMDLDEKFICLAIRYGYKKKEVAYIMGVHPATVTRIYLNLIIKIKIWQLTQ